MLLARPAQNRRHGRDGISRDRVVSLRVVSRARPLSLLVTRPATHISCAPLGDRWLFKRAPHRTRVTYVPSGLLQSLHPNQLGDCPASLHARGYV